MDVSGVDVKVEAKADLTPAVKAGSDIATKSHKGVSKFVYALCGPWMEKRIANAKLIEAQGIQNCLAIEDGAAKYADGKLIPFAPQATMESSFEALHKLNHASDAKRLHAAMQEAARQISEVPEEQVSDEPLSQDFFNHWRREAEMIDDEEFRKWWAGLLVEETKKPQSISPRTLDMAKNLSKHEAEIFQRMIKGIISSIIPVNPKGHPQFISYSESLIMEEAGLLIAHLSSNTWSARVVDEGQKVILALPDKADYVLLADGESLAVDCFLLTLAGQELAKFVLEKRSASDVLEIAKFLSERHTKTNFSVHERVPNAGGISWTTIPSWVVPAKEASPKTAQGVNK